MSASPTFPKKPLNWLEEVDQLRDSGIFFRLWRKPTSEIGPKFRLLFLIHGFGEHSGRYEHLCHYLKDSVDGIATFDHYGHGKSPGNRGSCNSSEDWLASSEQAFQLALIKLRREGYEVETQAMGHSFGGLISILLAKRGVYNGIKGLTLSAPLLALTVPPPFLKVKAGELLEPFLPQLSLKNEIAASVVSHDPDVIMSYVGDPLNHNRITPRGFKEMNALMRTALEWQGPFPCPLHLILPGSDPLVDERVTFKWFMRLDSQTRAQRVLDMFPGYRHESMNEIGKERVFNAIEAQIRRRW